jgi:hypothetical protein
MYRRAFWRNQRLVRMMIILLVLWSVGLGFVTSHL